MSKQFLVTECFFNLFLEVSQIQEIRTKRIQIGKKYWDLEMCRKSWKKDIFALFFYKGQEISEAIFLGFNSLLKKSLKKCHNFCPSL